MSACNRRVGCVGVWTRSFEGRRGYVSRVVGKVVVGFCFFILISFLFKGGLSCVGISVESFVYLGSCVYVF